MKEQREKKSYTTHCISDFKLFMKLDFIALLNFAIKKLFKQ